MTYYFSTLKFQSAEIKTRRESSFHNVFRYGFSSGILGLKLCLSKTKLRIRRRFFTIPLHKMWKLCNILTVKLNKNWFIICNLSPGSVLHEYYFFFWCYCSMFKSQRVALWARALITPILSKVSAFSTISKLTFLFFTMAPSSKTYLLLSSNSISSLCINFFYLKVASTLPDT